MLASHTSIRHLFSKCLSQYEKLRKKQAFLDNYRKFPMFAVSCQLNDCCNVHISSEFSFLGYFLCESYNSFILFKRCFYGQLILVTIIGFLEHSFTIRGYDLNFINLSIVDQFYDIQLSISIDI